MPQKFNTIDELEAEAFRRTMTTGDVHLEWRDESPVMVSGSRVVGVVQR